MKKLGLLVATGLLVACGNPSESTSDSASPVVVEHSGDDRRKAILWEVDSGAPSRILYCEVPTEYADYTCPIDSAIAMTLSTYQARLGDSLDRLFPQYGDAVAAAKARLDATNAALGPLQTAQQDLATKVANRQGEVAAVAKPLEDQLQQLVSSYYTLSARYDFVVSEITRIQGRLADPTLSANDHDVLTAKLAAMTTERDADYSQLGTLSSQMSDLQREIDTIVNHDTALTQLQADLAVATKKVADAEGQVTQATADLAAATGARDGKLGDALKLVASLDFHATDFGDDASRLLFDPFRAAGAPYATGNGCTTMVYDSSQYGYYYWSFHADPGLIFPAMAIGPTQTLEVFENEGAYYYVPGSASPSNTVHANWPALAGVPAPTGGLTCQYQSQTPASRPQN